MDLSKVKEIITPAGSLKKILRGDVVIWSKKSDLVYTIWKDGVLIDRVTMPQFVNKIHNGDAQTDYGIGAQIYVPYTDPFNGVTYDCPFNFGTFTQYPGKLGLQTHYALPSESISYGANRKSSSAQYDCLWQKSYLYQWLNASGITTINGFNGKNGFLSCLPEDFVEVISTVTDGENDIACKVFLLSREQSCCSSDIYKVNKQYGYMPVNRTTLGTIWEYWENKIGQPQEYISSNNNRIVYKISNQSIGADTTILSRCVYRRYDTSVLTGTTVNYYQYSFSSSGQFSIKKASDESYYQPACVIG